MNGGTSESVATHLRLKKWNEVVLDSHKAA